MSRVLTFGGVPSNYLGLRINGVNVYDAPATEWTSYKVPGRPGEVLASADLSQIPNQIRSYTAALYKRNASAEETERALEAVRGWCLGHKGYADLRDSYEPDFYRRAYFAGTFAPERRGAGNNFVIPLTFSCDPRRFLVNTEDYKISGEGEISIPGEVDGFAIQEPARPHITIAMSTDYVTLTLADASTGEDYGKLIVKGASQDEGSIVVAFDAEDLTATYTEDISSDVWADANDRIEDVIGSIELRPGGVLARLGTALATVTIRPMWWVR